MAAIVATLLYLPACVVLGLSLGALGIPLDWAVTFGGSYGRTAGLLIWWLLAFFIACIYIACAFPWDERIMAWPKKR